MAITTYSTEPHFDDFNDIGGQFSGAEKKNYLRILFNPGRSVQVRELNQMQSMLQSQIDKLGSSIYKEGPVLRGLSNLDVSAHYIDIDINEAVSSYDITAYLDQIKSIKTSSVDGTLKASVLHYKLNVSGSYRFFIRYNTSVVTSNANVQTFAKLKDIRLDNSITDIEDEIIISTSTVFGTITSLGDATVANIDSGIYYIKGEFVYNDAQSVYISHPTVDYEVSGRLTYVVTEQRVKYTDDVSLLDNATGTPNETAPGADRYAITLETLFISEKQNLATTDNANVVYKDAVGTSKSYVTLLTVDRGVVAKAARTEYTQLDRKFATRTSEESGDYCVKPFKLDLREYLNDEAGNRGRFTNSQIVDDGDAIDVDAADVYGEAHYLLGLEPSTAYVQGYRVGLQNKKELKVDKARQSYDLGANYTTLSLGNYVVGDIKNASGTNTLPDFASPHIEYALEIGGPTTNGTCRVRSLDKISDNRYHLYLYDVSLPDGKLMSDVTAIFSTTNSTTFKFGPLKDPLGVTLPFELLEVNDNSLIFQLPYNTVKSVTPEDIVYKFTAPYVNATTAIECGTGDFYSTATSDYIGVGSDGTTYNLFKEPDPVANSIVLNFGDNSSSVVKIIAPIKISNTTAAVKSVFTAATTKPPLSISTGDSVQLDHYDIIKITSVMADSENITDQFDFDNGQRDNYYQNGKIVYTGADTITTSSDLVITYDYFVWSSGEFFSANSYNYSGITADISYGDIPTHNDIPLSDVLDFRPYKDTNGNIASPRPIDPNSVVSMSALDVYLPRHDKVVVSTIGDFSVIQGTPSLNPIVPPTPGDSMALYELSVPAYTFNTKDIRVQQIDNRRYTTRDIGTIEKRVKNLEYYTSLSLLEQEATEKKIFSVDGVERFKNGILVDSFIGHNIGNPFDSKYKCAIDQDLGVLRPTYTTTNVQFGIEFEDDGTTPRTEETISLPRGDDEVLITQPYASVSESVNPFDVASWLGVMKLSPSMDEWKETRQRPDVVINSTGAADAIQFIAEETNVLGTKWNEWETNWTGVDTQKENVQIGRSDRGSNKLDNRAAKKALTGSNQWRPLRGSITTTTTTTQQAREGIRRNMSFREQQENLGERVVDISFVPFIRSRRIEIKGEMFKPGTKLHVFFDGIDISGYCTKITSASTPHVANQNSVESHFNDEPVDISALSSRIELITDDAGDINIACFIPNNKLIKFKTGERLVKLTDSPNNSDTEATSYSFATYTASGVIETKETTILSTRIPEIDQTRLSNSRTLTDTDRDVKVRYYDPLAQSFVIGEINTGASITKVDLFFQKKHASIPVTMHLVTVENGVPTQSIVPFSKVVKKPSGVVVSDNDASRPTAFEFDAPVYLQPGVEYAIVVMSNSPEYRLWMAETGGEDVNGLGRIDKNPYAGVSFKSQNASTWTPDQSRDFKFTMYRAKYETVDKQYTFNTLIDNGTAQALSNLRVMAEVVSLPKTSITWEIKYGGIDSTFTPININETTYLDAVETLKFGASGTILRATMGSTSDYISPMLDLSRLSILGITNVISTQATSVINAPDEDSRKDDGFLYLTDSNVADVQYITRTVDLNDPADRLNIYLLGNRPTESSNIHVLVKLKTDDLTSYDDVEWYEVRPSKTIPVNSDGSYSEIEFDFNPEALSNADDKYKNIEFAAFAVKIVLTSDSIVNIPTVQDFRAIATFEN